MRILAKITQIKRLVFIVFICALGSLSAQNNMNSLPKDPLEGTFIRNKNLSFLLHEDSCYNFYISDIIPLPDGYIILASTEVDGYCVYPYIVTPKKNPDIKIRQKKIKKGNCYKLRLRKYFLLPASVGIESGRIIDVMMGNRTMSVNENGFYSYLFTSFDIEGLYQIKDQEVAIRKRKFQEEELNLKNSVLPFLEYISYRKYADNLFDIVDTLHVKNSLNRYGACCWGRNPSDDFSHPEKYEWGLAYPPKKHNWEETDGINPRKYEEIFWGMLKKEYRLPIDSQNMDEDFFYSSIKLKLLYYSQPEIYTVQVIWKIPNVKKTFVAIINIQKTKDRYKIIGFNKPYRRYNLYLEENERYVPE